MPASQESTAVSAQQDGSLPMANEAEVERSNRPQLCLAEDEDYAPEMLTIPQLMAKMIADDEKQSSLVDIVVQVLDEVLAENDARRLPARDIFVGRKMPFAASYYIRRILKYTKASPSCIVLGFYYLTKLNSMYADVLLNSCTIQKLLLTAMMVAAKYLEDATMANSYW
mmetsp:Transcript_86274/g.230411  ORF Transcript_86274/g.230411 Transcript_86274/m.230411 type:complete len:169 (-) Transcript_86274:368-874(-)